jgi:lysophospholipid acyltransferase (LPLAT)-like uncharacterized protein
MKYLSQLIHALLQRLVWLIVKSLISTYKIEVQGAEFRELAKTLHPKGAFIFAVWHEQVLAVMTGHAWSRPYLALASRSKDGDYAAYVSKKMGFIPVRGSSKKKNKEKGGKEAMLEYIHKMREGTCGGITVDGPKGPRQVCKPGIVVIAKETGAPILPVVGLAAKYWEFNSWDSFKIPKPFTKVILRYGPPILVKPDLGQEKITETCQQVSESLKALQTK